MIKICKVPHQSVIDQLVDERFAQAFDVHGRARRKVLEASTDSCRTREVVAPPDHLFLVAVQLAPADWALAGHLPGLASLGVRQQRLHHFRDDVAPALHFHPVADLHAQALDLVHVVQGGATDCGAADRNRFQLRNRREFAGASDLHMNALDLRDSRPRGVLVRDRPARGFAGKAELPVQNRTVDLDYDSINFVG